jgi:hypothetical protein
MEHRQDRSSSPRQGSTSRTHSPAVSLAMNPNRSRRELFGPPVDSAQGPSPLQHWPAAEPCGTSPITREDLSAAVQDTPTWDWVATSQARSSAPERARARWPARSRFHAIAWRRTAHPRPTRYRAAPRSSGGRPLVSPRSSSPDLRSCSSSGASAVGASAQAPPFVGEQRSDPSLSYPCAVLPVRRVGVGGEPALPDELQGPHFGSGSR